MLEEGLGMARPATTFTHDGEDWQARFAWGCANREHYTIGVLFLAQTTNREAFGRLRGIPPERFDHAPVDQLREALIAALSAADD